MSARLIGRTACCLLLGAVTISGTPIVWQAPGDPWPATDETLHALLTSPDPADWAWGAWLARRDRRNELIPRLEEVVRRTAPLRTWEAGAALDAALDALIQLGAAPSAGLALAVYPRRLDQALILLSRLDSGADAELLAILAREAGARWYAAANTLLARRAPGMADVLRAQLNGGDRDKSDGCFWGSNRSTFPPRAYYSLTLRPASDTERLNQGPQPVYYHRWVMPRESIVMECEGVTERFYTDAARTYLAALERR